MSLLPPPSRLLFFSTPLSMTTTMLIRIWYDESVTTSSLFFLDSSSMTSFTTLWPKTIISINCMALNSCDYSQKESCHARIHGNRFMAFTSSVALLEVKCWDRKQTTHFGKSKYVIQSVVCLISALLIYAALSEFLIKQIVTVVSLPVTVMVFCSIHHRLSSIVSLPLKATSQSVACIWYSNVVTNAWLVISRIVVACIWYSNVLPLTYRLSSVVSLPSRPQPLSHWQLRVFDTATSLI